MGGYRRTSYHVTVQISRSLGQPWVQTAERLLIFDGTRRHLTLKGEQLPGSVSSALAGAADLNELSGVAEIAVEDHIYRLNFTHMGLWIF